MELFYRFERMLKARISELCDELEIIDRSRGSYYYATAKNKSDQLQSLLKLNRFYLDILHKKAKPRPDLRVISGGGKDAYNRLRRKHLRLIKGGWYE